MLHVFVETNWVVAYAAPAHRRTPAARELLERAIKGELRLHLPAVCLVEARRTIQTKFQPRTEADAIRQFLGWAARHSRLTDAEREVSLRIIDMYESHVRNELAHLDETLKHLRGLPGVEIFALDDAQLSLSIEIGYSCDLQPFDQSVLGAVAGRSDSIRATEPDATIAFCELDGDLQPWDRWGRPRPELANWYAPRAITVFGDFDMGGIQ